MIHAYAAEFTQHCGVRPWQSNSLCAHFTARDPLGPFTRRDVVNPVWCHNPSITVTPEGEWLMYHVGSGVPSTKPQYTNCSDGATIGKVAADLMHTAEGAVGASELQGPTMSVFSSPGPDGPWKDNRVSLVTSTGWPTGGLSNPAPLPPHSLAALNHSAGGNRWMVMFAARNRYGAWSSQLGIARAAAWDAQYVLDADPVCSGPLCRNGSTPDWRTFCEDPFVWTDADGTYHQLCNSKDCPPRGKTPPPPHYPYLCNGYGMHAYSPDGVSWTWSTTPAYDKTVELADGTTWDLGRRERPHILFDTDGTPTHLYCAVTGALPGAMRKTDRSNNFVQALHTGKGA